MLLYFSLSLLSPSFANGNIDLPEVKTEPTVWLGSNSICLDGIVAIMGGKGCETIRVLDIDSERTTVECLDKNIPDSDIKGVFTVAPIDHLKYMTDGVTPPEGIMCMDSDVALFKNQ